MALPGSGPGEVEALALAAANRGSANGMNGMVSVHVVRHGATAMNNQTDMSEDRIRGHRDVPLAPEGREDARKAAEKLRPFGIQVIVCSDLSRAAETAQIISEELGGIPVQVNPNLRPWDLGTFTGQTTKEALPQIISYVHDRPDQPVPGGESFNQFKDHANKGLLEAIEVANGRVLCVVTHHRDERLWRAEQAKGWTGDLDLDIFAQKGDPPGGVFEMNVNPAALSPNGGAPAAPPGAPAASPLPAAAGAPPPGLPVPAGQPGQPPGPPQPPQPDPMMAVLMKMQQITKAIDLLRSDSPRGYRIDIEIDTMVAGDHEQEREDAAGLLKAITDFITAAGQIVPHLPQFAPLAAKMLQFGVRKYRTGRDLESAIDEFADQIAKAPPGSLAPQPPPAKGAQTDPSKVEAEKIRGQAELAKAHLDAQSAQANDQREGQLKQMEYNFKLKEFQFRMAELERTEQLKIAEHNRRMADHAAAAQTRVLDNGTGLSA